MAVINHGRKQVRFKIVYCGTPLGGKTSNLQYVHRRLDKSQRGDMISVATAANRTLFFDYLPVNAMEIAGYETRFQLYTIPGQRVYDQTREIVLRGADGLVFVADSAPDRAEDNLEALSVTAEVLNRLGQSMSTIPLVYQHNKRDLPRAMPLSSMERLLNRRGLPSFPAVATTGYQVFASLESITQAVLRRFYRPQRSTGAALGESHPVPVEDATGSGAAQSMAEQQPGESEAATARSATSAVSTARSEAVDRIHSRFAGSKTNYHYQA